MDKKRSLLLFIIFLLVIFLVEGCQPLSAKKKEEKEEKGAKFFPTKRPSAIAGKQIFDQKCASCHGPQGKGDGPTAANLAKKPANFTNLKFMRKEEPAEFFEVITEGKKPMPSWKKKLTKNQRWDVLFYEWSFATNPQKIAAGKDIYTKFCKNCHGETGKGDGPSAKRLKKKPEDLTKPKHMMGENKKEFFEVITKGDKPMPAFKKKLTTDQRWDVIDYIWTFVYEPLP